MDVAPFHRPSYFQLYKEHCSDSDLGPISLSWFDELTAEAAPYIPSTCDIDEGAADYLDENDTKTPVRKAYTFSQLDSTPIMFKEDVLSSPLFLSPTKESWRCISQADTSTTNIPLRCPIQTEQQTNKNASPSCRSLSESPIVLKELFKTPLRDQRFRNKTPQRDGKPGVNDSLFCTPKLMKSNALTISQSLGADADSEMSWTSSLATPPSPTVIIVKDNENISRSKIYDNKTAVIVQSLFSKRNNAEEGKTLAVPHETPDNKELTTSCAVNKGSVNAAASSCIEKVPWKQTVANAVKDKEVYQTVENVLEGMEDVLSIFFTNERNSSLRKVRTGRVERKRSSKMEFVIPSISRSPEGSLLIPPEKPFPSPGQIQTLTSGQKHVKEQHCETLTKEALSVYEWSQLNLCDMNTSQLDGLPISHTQGSKCRDLEAAFNAADAMNAPSVCMSSRYVSDVLTVEYTSTTSGKKVTVTKNSYVNLVNQSTATPQNKTEQKPPEAITENGNASVVQAPLTSMNPPLAAQSTSKKGSSCTLYDEGAHAVIPEVNPNGRKLLSTMKRQAKFLYCVTGTKGPQENGNRGVNSDVNFLTSKISPLKSKCLQDGCVSQDNKCEFEQQRVVGPCEDGDWELRRKDPEQLPENLQNLPSMKQIGRSRALESPCLMETIHTDLETTENISLTIKKKVLATALATAGLLAKKPLMGETLGRQYRNQNPELMRDVTKKNYMHHNRSVTTAQVRDTRSKDSSGIMCNRSPNRERKSELLLSASLSSRETSGLPVKGIEVLLQRNEAVPDTVENSATKCELKNGSKKIDAVDLDVKHSHAGNFLNAVHVQINKSQTRTSDCSETKRVSGVHLHQHPSHATFEHLATIKEEQIGKQDSVAFNKIPGLSQDSDLLGRCFEGFKTASNRKIQISEKYLMKGESLFKDIEAHCLVTDAMLAAEDQRGTLEIANDNLGDPASAMKFTGFKTATNKEIKVSESMYSKGRLLFRDLEGECSEEPYQNGGNTCGFDLFPKPESNMVIPSEANNRGNLFTSKSTANASCEQIDQNAARTRNNICGLNENVNGDGVEPGKRQSGLPGKMVRKSLFSNLVSLTEGMSKSTKDPSAKLSFPCHDSLTESQKAEITELSSILESADSQCEFTQFRNGKPVAKNLESLSSLNDSLGDSVNLNSSDVWRDVDFNDSFAAGDENCDAETGLRNGPHIDPQDKNVPDLEPSEVSSLIKSKAGGFGGFSLASGKSITIESKSLVKAAQIFVDLEESTDWIQTTKADGKWAKLPVKSVSKVLLNVSSASMKSTLKATVPNDVPGRNGTSEMDARVLDAAINVVGNAAQSETSEVNCIMSTESTACISKDTACSDHTKSDKESVQPVTDFGNGDFQTASGKNITILQSSLENVKHIFREDDHLDAFEVQCLKDKVVQKVQAGGKLLSSARWDGSAKCLLAESGINKDIVMGFHTAGGKKVTVAKDSLAKARNLFEKDQLDEDNKSRMQIVGQEQRNKDYEVVNCGALGKEAMVYNKNANLSEVLDHVDISGSSPGDALIHDAEGITNCNSLLPLLPNSNHQGPPVFTLGFTTGKGKCINIDKAAVLKARNMFSDISGMADVPQNDHHHTRLLNEPHNEESKENLSGNDCGDKHESHELMSNNEEVPMRTKDVILQKANHLERTEGVNVLASHMDPLCAFSTASGKAVAVSNESYQKAKLMFSQSADLMPGSEYDLPPQVAKSSNQGAEMAKGTHLDVTSRNGAHQPLSPLSESRLAVYESKKGSERADVCSYSEAREKAAPSCHDQKLQSKDLKKVSSKDAAASLTMFFSTASGKSVQLSEESLRKAREMFNEVDPNEAHLQIEDTNLAVVCSKRIPKAVSHLSTQTELATEEEQEILKAKCSLGLKTNTHSFGFNTASGRKVSISDSALEKVKGIFQQFDDLGSLEETQVYFPIAAPAEENILAGMVRKIEQTEAFDSNLNHCQRKMPELIKGSHTNGKYPADVSRSHSTPLCSITASAHCSIVPPNSKLDVCFSALHTPQNDYEVEAAESAKAFMDDEDLVDTEPNTGVLFPQTNKAVVVRSGKRLRSDDGMQCGEPPLKRQLLPEFDRATQSGSKPNLKPLTSSPNGTMKDRRKCLFNVTLQPSTCSPASLQKGRKDNLLPKITEPKQFISTSNDFSRWPHPTKPVHNSSDDRSHLNISLNDSTQTPNQPINAFVPPFKKKQPSANVPMVYPQGHVQHGLTNPLTDKKEYNNVKACSAFTEVQDDSDFSDLASNICCARDMQGMRLRKKQRQKVKPQPGSLYLAKTASSARIPLRSAVHGKTPGAYAKEQLYVLGVVKSSLGINSENSESFQFSCLDYFTKDCLLSENGVQIADGGWLVPAGNLRAGKEEFYRALCDTPGVDPKLISPEWVYNHYRWIIWKLAALELRFPEFFACKCLTPESVLLQLKYRYDVEIDKALRPAIRKFMERDDSPSKTLVLCIASVISQGTNLSNSCGNKNEPGESKQRSAVIEVTDGWYGIKALLDPALTTLLRQGKLFTGQKIITHGAELVGSDDACAPLEAPESLMLKLSANSTRPAAWFAKLGYFRDPRPFCLPLSSLYSEGGVVGCVDVLIQRIYPIQYMEKMASGLYMFRNERAEEKEAEKHSAKQQKSLEILFAKIQAEFEQQEASSTRRRGLRHSLNRQQICTLQDGAEIYDAIQAESDPGYLESCLSNEQQRALNQYRQMQNDKKQAQIQTEFRKAIEASEQAATGCAKREVTPVWKIRIVDYKDQESEKAYTLNIWRPLLDVLSLLKEGSRFKIYNLAASPSKGKSDTADVQLTATKKTQFQQLQPSQDMLVQTYIARDATSLDRFLDPTFTAPYGEVDVVGLVISTYKKSGAAPVVYLSDEAHNVLAVKFWTDLGQLALEELTKPCTLIAASNLRWRSECTSGVPTVHAVDLSTISSNPKEPHLQKPIQMLRQSIQSVEEFRSEAIIELLKLQQASNRLVKRSAELMVEPHTPTCKDVSATNCHLTPVTHSGIKSGNPDLTPDAKPYLPASRNETDPKVCKQLRGLDYLSRVPSPPPITPVRSFVSPYLQRAFRPPRSSDAHKACTQVKGHKDDNTPRKDLKNAHREGGFVADEELALINTQALMLGLEQEKSDPQQEPNKTRENMTITGHLTGCDSQKPSSDTESADTLQRVSPKRDEHKTNEDGLLLCQKKLQRKRKRRL